MNKKVSLLAVVGLLLFPLMLSACASPTPAATAVPTEAVVPAATEVATAAPTEAAAADSVAASDQTLGADNTLVVDKVVAAADGWIVIHADAAGKPGTVLGYAAVKKGENDKVKITLTDTKDFQPVEWAMLHIDAGTIGTYEFPGADAPVKDAAGMVVMMSFKAGGAPAAAADSVMVVDQKMGSDNTLVIAKVVAAADGWLVIHADAAGKPGTVLGYAAVKKGENDNVKVTITDTKDMVGVEWAMLHIDAGTIGKYEFPGADGPVKDAAGMVVMMSFKAGM